MNDAKAATDFLHARAFRGLMLDSAVAHLEEEGALLRAKEPTAGASLLGKFDEYFSREVQDRAQTMTYVYAIYYCFENLVRDLVAQRLVERKGENWWEACVPAAVRNRVA